MEMKKRINTHKYMNNLNVNMAHKTITISEEAYNLLKENKRENESFTEVIKRILTHKKKKEDLIEWLSSKKDLLDLADSVESVFDERRNINLRF
jgi:predicted CopG family antitoxin